MKNAKLCLLAAGLVCCVLVQGTRPLLADGAVVLRSVSYSPGSATSSPPRPMARTKRLRLACYPAGVECTRDSDCCTGFCRVGRVNAYCDNK